MSGGDPLCTTLTGETVDSLVLKGIQHIKLRGDRLRARSGSGLQAYCVDYVLTNSRARLHLLRYPTSVRYFCRELLAFFRGSLNVYDGLAEASRTWLRLAAPEGKINSNYGYYVFRQQTKGVSQYEWVIQALQNNLQSRRALININQPIHKDFADPDFPCAIALQFYVRRTRLCIDALVRSADVMTGLPYDIGFFSFLTELVARDVSERTGVSLSMGYTRLRSSFTQLYDHNLPKAETALDASRQVLTDLQMPPIDSAVLVLSDIIHGTAASSLVRWIHEHADMEDQRCPRGLRDDRPIPRWVEEDDPADLPLGSGLPQDPNR